MFIFAICLTNTNKIMANKKVTTIRMCAKTVDQCNIKYLDEDENFVGERDDYVPDYFPNEHYGDYVEFDIDVATGKILNWVVPTQAEIKSTFQ